MTVLQSYARGIPGPGIAPDSTRETNLFHGYLARSFHVHVKTHTKAAAPSLESLSKSVGFSYLNSQDWRADIMHFIIANG